MADQPELVWPTTRVRASYLAGERSDCLARGNSVDWLTDATADFDSFVAARRGVQERWDVPSTVFWYVRGPDYLGTLVIRHHLTAALTQVGGHIGYHVVTPWQRQGHATRMLGAGLRECRRLKLERVLITCDTANVASRKVIQANGGIADGPAGDEARFWIEL